MLANPEAGRRLLPASFWPLALLWRSRAASEKGAHQAEDRPPTIRPVRTVTVNAVTFRLSGSVTGTIEARAEADLGFRIAGKLIER